MAAIKAASGVWEKVYASTTYLGIGERAGNAETEKVLLNLYLHHGVKKYEGKTQKLKATADYIGKATGYVVPPNKAIVGDYGFAHESGIHTHGVLNDPWTYEPYPPELVGNMTALNHWETVRKRHNQTQNSRTCRQRTRRPNRSHSSGQSKRNLCKRQKSIIKRRRIQKNPSHTKNPP